MPNEGLLEEYEGLTSSSELGLEESLMNPGDDPSAVQDPKLFSTSQLFTASINDHFYEACIRYGIRHDFERMAAYCNEKRWPNTGSRGIRKHKAVDMAWRFGMLDDGCRYLRNEGYTNLTKGLGKKRAVETDEVGLAAEVKQAEEWCRQEEQDVRKIGYKRSKLCLSHKLLRYASFRLKASRIMENNDVWISGPAFAEFAAILVNWTRSLVRDVLLFEDELRWGRRRADPGSQIIHKSSLIAAFKRNGLPTNLFSDEQDKVEANRNEDDSINRNWSEREIPVASENGAAFELDRSNHN